MSGRTLASILLAGALLVGPAQARAADLSAETLAIVHDLMRPHRGAAAEPAVSEALRILRSERLVDLPRPTTRPLGLTEKLGRALALGRRGAEFLPDMAAVRDALVRRNEARATEAIQDLYEKMGRKRPEGSALAPLLSAAREVVGREPQETERIAIEKPGYRVVIENARAAGTARVAVLMDAGPGGGPARVEFKGDVATRPDGTRKDLEILVTPDERPRSLTSAQALALRARLNGRWRDQDGTVWEISGEGGDIVLAEHRTAREPRRYSGSFRLGLVEVRFPISRAEDMGEDLPLDVRERLAGMGLDFTVVLDYADETGRLDGTWSSRHVTYAPGDPGRLRVHSPYHLRLTLTRAVGGRGGLALRPGTTGG